VGDWIPSPWDFALGLVAILHAISGGSIFQIRQVELTNFKYQIFNFKSQIANFPHSGEAILILFWEIYTSLKFPNGFLPDSQRNSFDE
jgi:hypothetical protein